MLRRGDWWYFLTILFIFKVNNYRLSPYTHEIYDNEEEYIIFLSTFLPLFSQSIYRIENTFSWKITFVLENINKIAVQSFLMKVWTVWRQTFWSSAMTLCEWKINLLENYFTSLLSYARKTYNVHMYAYIKRNRL